MLFFLFFVKLLTKLSSTILLPPINNSVDYKIDLFPLTMSDVITQLFDLDISSAVAHSLSAEKPLFVYTTTANDKLVETFLTPQGSPDVPTVTRLAAGFVCLKIAHNLEGFRHFQHIYADATAPAFTVLVGGKTQGVVTEDLDYSDFMQLIDEYAAGTADPSHRIVISKRPNSVENHKSAFAPNRSEDKIVRALHHTHIAVEGRDTDVASNSLNDTFSQSLDPQPSQASKPVPQSKQAPSPETFVLSVRLLNGSTMKGKFSADSTLMDVKRWVEAEQEIDLTSTEAGLLDMFTKPGFPEPSRIAFYAPGTNVTYSVPQELCRLRDLDLCSRLALILKPEFHDLSALHAPVKPTLLSKTSAKLSTMLLALYSFFDYGVDDAQRDFGTSDTEDEVDEIPHFTIVAKDAARAVEPPVEVRVPLAKEEAEMDYSLVSLARLGTPAPSGSSSLHMSELKDD